MTVAVVALGVAAGIAQARSVYETAFVAAGGAEVPRSEGKVGPDGSYKVEIEPVPADMRYEICIVDAGGRERFLAEVRSDADGELKSVGGAGSIAGASHRGFAFRVRDDSRKNDCSGDLNWASDSNR